MEEVMYQLTKLIPYFIMFPFFSLLTYITLYCISRRKIDKESISIYGIFINLNNKDLLLLSLALMQFILQIESLFVMDFSYYIIIFIYLPIILFDIVSKSFFRFPIDLFNSTLITVLLFFKDAFYSYIMNVSMLWYIFMLFLVLCIFITVISTYSFVNNFNYILDNKK